MDRDYDLLLENMIMIASETCRFQRVFEKTISKLSLDEQTKYMSQYNWFYKRVNKALDAAGLRLVSLEGQLFDPGMAVTPLNLEDFETDDTLYIAQMMEPIVMKDSDVVRTGTVILGRIEK